MKSLLKIPLQAILQLYICFRIHGAFVKEDLNNDKLKYKILEVHPVLTFYTSPAFPVLVNLPGYTSRVPQASFVHGVGRTSFLKPTNRFTS